MTLFHLLSQRLSSSSHVGLAATIIASAPNNEYVSTICSSADFEENPVDCLIHEMIERGVAMIRSDDHARVLIMRQVPHLVDKITSPAYLSKFAQKFFKDEPKKMQILEIFNRSLKSESFLKSLKHVKEKGLTYDELDHRLRICLTIYRQSAKLREYTRSTNMYLELKLLD